MCWSYSYCTWWTQRTSRVAACSKCNCLGLLLLLSSLISKCNWSWVIHWCWKTLMPLPGYWVGQDNAAQSQLSILFSNNSECSLARHPDLQLVSLCYIFSVYSFLSFEIALQMSVPFVVLPSLSASPSVFIHFPLGRWSASSILTAS